MRESSFLERTLEDCTDRRVMLRRGPSVQVGGNSPENFGKFLKILGELGAFCQHTLWHQFCLCQLPCVHGVNISVKGRKLRAHLSEMWLESPDGSSGQNFLMDGGNRRQKNQTPFPEQNV